MMKPIQSTLGARIVALSLVLAGAAACGERLSNTSSGTPTQTAASPSAVVIGQAPAEPPAPAAAQAPAQGDTPQTTSPVGARSELSKSAESTQQPLEGNTNSHSTLAPAAPQKAEGVNPQELPARNRP